MNSKINLETLKEKIEADKKTKKETLIRKLEILTSVIRSKDELDDFQIKSIMQDLLDYKKSCVAFVTVDTITNEDENVRMDRLLELL